MLAAMDRDIGRLMVSTGLAHRGRDGQLVYDPGRTNTMVVILGDNGTFSTSVKAPYDAFRSKATVYETGVAAPLIVAGPLVARPGRTVTHLVNAVDLFRLFGEIAQVDVRAVVPSSRVLDAEPMLAYLTSPDQPSLRKDTFTQLGTGLKPPSVTPWPCVQHVGAINIANDILFTDEGPCDDLGGTWFGPTASQPDPPYPTSCDIKDARLFDNLMITPTRVWAVRTGRYKLVKVERPACDRALGEFEFYDLSPDPPREPDRTRSGHRRPADQRRADLTEAGAEGQLRGADGSIGGTAGVRAGLPRRRQSRQARRLRRPGRRLPQFGTAQRVRFQSGWRDQQRRRRLRRAELRE